MFIRNKTNTEQGKNQGNKISRFKRVPQAGCLHLHFGSSPQSRTGPAKAYFADGIPSPFFVFFVRDTFL